jgi:hypothetical protein
MRRTAALLAAVALLLAALGAGASAARAAATGPTQSGVGALGTGVPPIKLGTAPGAGTTTTPVTTAATATTTADPNALTSPPSLTVPPTGHRLTANQAIKIADGLPKVRKQKRAHRGTYANAYEKGATQWQVSYFPPGRTRVEIAQVTIDDASGGVIEAWTGYQVPWTMARGYDGAFGRRVNAWYVWLPFCLLFVAPFLPRRRRHVSWLHVDLLVLLGFSVSLYFFNRARIGLSVPLIYPLLGYLLLRMLVVARRPARPEPLRLLVPVSWLVVGIIFLVGFRVGLNVTNSNVIDVGYSGVIGANRLAHGTPLYGTWPSDNAHGDTYGPVDYYAYVPFERLLGWSGRWDDLPAAHAAAIAFDLLTIVGLFLLGRRVRGPTLGIVLAYAWAAFPFTLYVSNTNGNDSLVALLIVAALLAATSPPARGAFAALAGLTKFAPLALAPLLSRTPSGFARARPGPPRSGPRAFVGYALAFAVTAALAMLPVILDGSWRTFWNHSLGFQQDRGSPFSLWGLYGGLHGVQKAVQLAAIAFALALGIWPRRPTIIQVAALGAAVLIALQLSLTYWFYLYIAWFFPLVMLALFGRLGLPAGDPPDTAATAPAAAAQPAAAPAQAQPA